MYLLFFLLILLHQQQCRYKDRCCNKNRQTVSIDFLIENERNSVIILVYTSTYIVATIIITTIWSIRRFDQNKRKTITTTTTNYFQTINYNNTNVARIIQYDPICNNQNTTIRNQFTSTSSIHHPTNNTKFQYSIEYPY